MAAENTRAPWTTASLPAAGDEDLSRHGGLHLPDGVQVNGWRIATRHTPILGREELRRCVSSAARACAARVC